MKNFLSFHDVSLLSDLLREAENTKQDLLAEVESGRNRILGLLFFNSSLRTRMSTIKAAYNLGMKVIILNVSQDSWQLEMEDGVVMDAGKAEHVREAAAVMGTYCDFLGIRSFPSLVSREEDYREIVLTQFQKYAGVPIINLESATLHPLQSFADLITIEELKKKNRPKVVMTWAPHTKGLPQAVANSFAQWMQGYDADFHIAHPEGLELDEEFSAGAELHYSQEEAFSEADFIYVKNWSGYRRYGEIHHDPGWMLNKQKMAVCENAHVMHCLPVRRNVVITDEVLDSKNSVVLQQAENRVVAAQVVLKNLLKSTY